MPPTAIYFDTNALNQLVHGETNVDFIELRQVSKERVGLFAPDVVVRELVHHRQLEALEQMARIRQASQSLRRLLFRESHDYEDVKDVEDTVRTGVLAFLGSLEILTIPTPQIELEVLLDMAIKKDPPFEEKREKGFRDSVILFTILQHMQNNHFSSAILVSGDQVFGHKGVLERFRRRSISISVAKNVNHALEIYKTQIEEALSSFIEETAEQIKSFLGSRFRDISDYIFEHGEISESFIRGGLFGTSEELLGTTVKKILAVHPKAVSRVRLGLVSKEDDEAVPPGWKGITFSVSLDIDLLVNTLRLHDLFGPRVPIAALEAFEKVKYTYAPPNPDEQITVQRELTIQALLKGLAGTYTDLQLVKVLSY